MELNKLDRISSNNTLQKLDKFLSLRYLNKYPYNLNSKLKDNIIETKRQIELEYKKDYENMVLYDVNDKKNKTGKGNLTIFIY